MNKSLEGDSSFGIGTPMDKPASSPFEDANLIQLAKAQCSFLETISSGSGSVPPLPIYQTFTSGSDELLCLVDAKYATISFSIKDGGTPGDMTLFMEVSEDGIEWTIVALLYLNNGTIQVGLDTVGSYLAIIPGQKYVRIRPVVYNSGEFILTGYLIPTQLVDVGDYFLPQMTLMLMQILQQQSNGDQKTQVVRQNTEPVFAKVAVTDTVVQVLVEESQRQFLRVTNIGTEVVYIDFEVNAVAGDCIPLQPGEKWESQVLFCEMKKVTAICDAGKTSKVYVQSFGYS